MAVDDSYTKALLHMDGADASTIFTDESGKTWTASGSAQIDTAQSVFGGASGYFDGTGDYISTPDSDDFYFDGAWTIDCRIRPTSLPAVLNENRFLWGQYVDSNNYSLGQLKHNGTNLQLVVLFQIAGAVAVSNYKSVAINVNTWYHLAWSFDGTNVRIFLDGVNLGTGVVNEALTNLASSFYIGQRGTNLSYFDGWIDEFRVSKGVARWTSNFTPPTSAYSPVTTIPLLSPIWIN